MKKKRKKAESVYRLKYAYRLKQAFFFWAKMEVGFMCIDWMSGTKHFQLFQPEINLYATIQMEYPRGNWHVVADFSISSSGPLHIHHRWRSKKQDSRPENYRIKFKTNLLNLFRFHFSTLILFLFILIFYLLSLFN